MNVMFLKHILLSNIYVLTPGYPSSSNWTCITLIIPIKVEPPITDHLRDSTLDLEKCKEVQILPA